MRRFVSKRRDKALNLIFKIFKDIIGRSIRCNLYYDFKMR